MLRRNRGRPTTQGERDARAAVSAAAVSKAVAAAAARGWIGCGDLVDASVRRTASFKLLPDEQRFAFSYVVTPDSGCWDWVAAKKAAGYGQIRFHRRNSNAHRVAWQIYVGQIADDMDIDHLCRNKGCVNPAHLEPVTNAENTRRWAVTITRCANGHLRTYRQRACPECARSPRRRKTARATVERIAAVGTEKVKLSDDDIAAMKGLRSEGRRVVDIARKYGVSAKYASALLSGNRQRRARYTGPTKGALTLVMDRAGGRCEFPACTDPSGHTHHRRPRRLGGSRDPRTNLPANLVRLCAHHHEWVESNRRDALHMGLLLHANEDPETVPVSLYDGSYLLDNLGGKRAFDDGSVEFVEVRL